MSGRVERAICIGKCPLGVVVRMPSLGPDLLWKPSVSHGSVGSPNDSRLLYLNSDSFWPDEVAACDVGSDEVGGGASSGFAILKPPSALDKLRSPFIVLGRLRGLVREEAPSENCDDALPGMV